MVVIINLSTNSGAVSEAKSHHNLETRKFRSLAKSATSTKGEFSSKNRHKLVQNGQKSDKKSQKKSAKKTQRSRKPIGQKKHKKSAKKTQKSEKPKGQKEVSKKHEKSAKKGKKKNFSHCDYIDLHELGHRGCSDFDCKPGGKFLVKV